MSQDYFDRVSPKETFVNRLQWMQQQAYIQIYILSHATNGIKQLYGIVNSLDAKTKKQNVELIEELREKTMSIDLIMPGDDNRLYDAVSTLLHEDYYKDGFRAQPANKKRGIL